MNRSVVLLIITCIKLEICFCKSIHGAISDINNGKKSTDNRSDLANSELMKAEENASTIIPRLAISNEGIRGDIDDTEWLVSAHKADEANSKSTPLEMHADVRVNEQEKDVYQKHAVHLAPQHTQVIDTMPVAYYLPRTVRTTRDNDVEKLLKQLELDAVIGNYLPTMPYVRSNEGSLQYGPVGVGESAIAIFPNIASNCAIPLLLSCSPQISKGIMKTKQSTNENY